MNFHAKEKSYAVPCTCKTGIDWDSPGLGGLLKLLDLGIRFPEVKKGRNEEKEIYQIYPFDKEIF